MKQGLLIFALAAIGIGTFMAMPGCVKSNPQPPVHDTLTVHDTITKTVTVPPAPDSAVNLTKGLLVYLPFSGNYADSSGNANPTQLVGAGTGLTYDTHGYADFAFGGNGTDRAVYVTNNGSIKFDTAFTLSFGFMVNAAHSMTFVSMIDPATGNSPSFTVNLGKYGSPSMIFGSEDVSLGCGVPGRNDNYNIADSSSFIPVPGSWYNVIAVYSKGTNWLYVNGKLIATKIGRGTKANLCPSAKMVIGGWWDYAPDMQFIDGKLDNVRLYNRVLTPHEIIELSKYYQPVSNSVRPVLQTN